MNLKIATCFLLLILMLHVGMSSAEHRRFEVDACRIVYKMELCRADAVFLEKKVRTVRRPLTQRGRQIGEYDEKELHWRIKVTYEPSNITCAFIRIKTTGLTDIGEMELTFFEGLQKREAYGSGAFFHQSGEIQDGYVSLDSIYDSEPRNFKILNIECLYSPSYEESERKFRQAEEERLNRQTEEEEVEHRYPEENRGKLEDLVRQEEESKRTYKESEELVDRKMSLEDEFESSQDLEKESNFEARKVPKEEEHQGMEEDSDISALARELDRLDQQDDQDTSREEYAPSDSQSSGRNYSGSGGVSQSCKRAQQRVNRSLASVNPNSVVGMCATYKKYLQVLLNARREFANNGCPAYAVKSLDQPIAQTRRGVRAVCTN